MSFLKGFLPAAAVAIMLVPGLGASGAQAQNTTHGCACIHNKTKAQGNRVKDWVTSL